MPLDFPRLPASLSLIFQESLCFEDAFTCSVTESVKMLWAGQGQSLGLGPLGGGGGVVVEGMFVGDSASDWSGGALGKQQARLLALLAMISRCAFPGNP